MVEKLTWIHRGTILILLVAFLLGCTGAVAATGDGAMASAQTPIEIDDRTPTGENTSSLSDTTVTSNSISPAETESDDTYGSGTQVAVTVVPIGESFGSDETMTIRVGTFENGEVPTPVANEDVTVTVERPDGTTDTFDEVTDSTGTVEIAYDLSTANRGDGTYTVSVTSPNVDDEATVSPSVGAAISPAERTYEQVLIDKETTVNFLVREGSSTLSQEPVTITVRDPSGNEITRQDAVSDANGFVDTSVAPQQQGDYEITAELQSTGARATQTITASEVLFRTDYELTRAIADEQSHYGGYLKDTTGLVTDQSLSVKIENPDTNEVIVDKTTTTGNSGFFSIEYSPGDADDLRATVVTSDGRVAVNNDYISVDDPQPEGTTGADLTAEFADYTLIPGEEATLQITATDEGSPLPDKEVTVFPRLGYDGALLEPQTVTTNASGEASVTITAPETAEAGGVDGAVYMRHNGEVISDSLFADIERYSINFDVKDVAPGEETTFSVDATDRVTGDAVSGIPLQYNALSSGSGVDSYVTGELVTNQSGVDSTTVSVPRDIEPDRAVNYISRYASTTLYRINMYDFPGSLSVTASNENEFGRPVAAPGEEITVEFTTSDSSDMNGIVFAEFRHGADAGASGTVIVPVSSSQETTLTVPEYAGNDSYLRINAWGANSADEFYSAEQPIEVRTTADPGTGDGSDGNNSDVPAIVGSDPPTDTTGDGKLNDINGDDRFTIADVQVFFENYNDTAVQNNIDAFDFNEDGLVNIADVQSLFNMT